MRSPRPSGDVIVAPLSRELRPLLRRVGARRTGSLPHGDRYAGRVGGRPLTLAVLGDGARRFTAGLEALSNDLRPRRALLVGVAGGLSPGFEPGSVVRAGRVLQARSGELTAEWVPPASPPLAPLADRRHGVEVGTVVTAERIVGSRDEKAALWRLAGEAERAVVDLESASFARFWAQQPAAEAPREWTILRAVSDPQENDLPLDFAAASDSGGHVIGGRVARQLAGRPGAMGALRELRRRVVLCADRLAAAAIEWIAEESAAEGFSEDVE